MDWKDSYQKQRAARDQQDTTQTGKAKKSATEQFIAQPRQPKASYTPERIVTIIWLAVTSIQLAIWLIICIASRNFVSPWWLWTGLGGGLVTAIVWAVMNLIRKK